MKNQVYMKASDGNVFMTFHPEYHKECQIIRPAAEGKRQYVAQVKTELLKRIKPGDTVYSIIRSVSASGMSRRISLFHVTDDGRMGDITYSAAVAMGYSCDDGSIKVVGCGMDMAFATVYNLGRALWPNGTPEPHGARNGVPDSDGGYSLKSSIL